MCIIHIEIATLGVFENDPVYPSLPAGVLLPRPRPAGADPRPPAARVAVLQRFVPSSRYFMCRVCTVLFCAVLCCTVLYYPHPVADTLRAVSPANNLNFSLNSPNVPTENIKFQK